MYEHDAVCTLPDGRTEHVARADRALAEGSLRHLDGPEEPGPYIEQHDVERLALAMRECRSSS